MIIIASIFGRYNDRQPDCEKVLRNEPYSNPICKNCHRSFVITQGDAQHFLGKGLNLPTRCPSCRGR